MLFCDLVGSTALGESTDPEALRALLARYFERMKSIVEEHGGSVEKFIGDAVMAVFGVPAVHEDDALRACRAAVQMREAFPGLGIEGRIGVSTGEVVTGTEERLATGDALNVAARLQQAAQPGEVLLAEATLALVREAVDVEPLEPLLAKGKSEPLTAYRLLAARAALGAAARDGLRRPRARAGAARAKPGRGRWRSGAASWSRSSPTRVSASRGWRRRRCLRSRRRSCAAAACPTGQGSPTGRSWRCSSSSTRRPLIRPPRPRSARSWGSRRRGRRRRRSPGRSASCSRSRPRSSLSSTTSSGVRRRSSTWSSISCSSPAAPRCWSSASPVRSCSSAAPPGR